MLVRLRNLLTKTLRLARNLRRDPDRARDIGRALLRGEFARAGGMALTVSRSSKVRGPVLISQRFRCLWIPNSKVASTSIRDALNRADPDAVTFIRKNVAEVYTAYPEARDYCSFAFVRHPYERALSFYAYQFLPLEGWSEQQLFMMMNFRLWIHREYNGMREVRSFDDFCDWLNTPWGSDRFANRHFRSQHVNIRLPDGRLPDFIGRLENIDEDFERFAAEVGMSKPVLPMMNTRAGWLAPPDAVKSARTAMRAYLTDRNRALLAARYGDDLDLYRSLCGERPEPRHTRDHGPAERGSGSGGHER